ncbi:MAG TPA: 5-bromo-4-chloroindolyl phosphate hydrolysis family protein [Candidatus Blautia intestinigallinarum]|nr:5-bromo-4-chloroindolyl phosphate hydrolysis family protein [Candidatus Blautia intestinigallinarum]
MRNQDWYDLGDKVQKIVQDAVNSRDFRQLNENITQTLNRAVRDGTEVLRNVLGQDWDGMPGGPPPVRRPRSYRESRQVYREQTAQRPPAQVKQERLLYSRTGGPRAQGIIEICAGIGLLGTGLLMAIGLLTLLIGGTSSAAELTMLVVFLLVFGGAGGFLLSRGLRMNRLVSHFKWFCIRLKGRTYCEIDELARYVGKTEKEIRKELYWMISKGWFRQGHVDDSETTLITSNQTYKEYLRLQKQREEMLRAQEEQRASMTSSDKDVQEVLDRGNHYLEEIRKSNDAIPGELISQKISHMEMVVQKIFQRAKEHPEVIPDLDKLMDYYLPVTVKLLDAYEDLIVQPVQGENILNSKKEIEDTLDTLNIAFEKLLDSIFQEEAWDISSDISVLKTVLAQEGLTKDDFQKE